MKPKEDKTSYFFGDESGDPTFYDRRGNYIVGHEGCSKILILGLIRTEDPQSIRATLTQLKNELSQDRYLQAVPSFKKSMQFFHAKDDIPEIREKVFKALVGLNFKAEFVVVRKIEKIFVSKHQSKEDLFYYDIVAHLFKNKLHMAAENKIYFATRSSRSRQEPIRNAVQSAIIGFESQWGIKIDSLIDVQAQTMTGEPCLQAVDYMNWAVQRAFIKGDMRYFDFVRPKVSLVLDIYDYVHYKNSGNYYSPRRNPFDITKISPL